MEKIQERMRQLERRQWWLWSAAAVVIILSAWVIASPIFLTPGASRIVLLQSGLQQALLVLLSLSLLFCGYSIHQHTDVRRLRDLLNEEIAEKSRLQTEVEDFYRLTTLDPLTGLYNQRFLEQHLAAEMGRSQRHGYQLNVLKIDIHNFRHINEHHGRPAGDLVLRIFAERLKKSIRNSDLSVRMGNDEFLILLPESSPERVPHILARLSGLEVEYRGEKIPITFAAGWTCHQPNENPQQLLDRAEQEVSADKHIGRAEEAIRRAQAEIRQMQNIEALGRLAGRVAHDFNNMLNLVKGYSELVLETLGRTDPLREYVEQIHQANERASTLTRQLLAFTRTQEGKGEILDLNAVVSGMEDRLQRMLGEQINLVVEVDSGLGPVRICPEDLEQIILNLAVNARDNMPQGGKLILETQNAELDEAYTRWHPGARPGPYVLLVARDTGVGLDPETRAHIFEPFLTLKGRGKRTGLGLATVYEIVKQSGGYVWVDSEPGQGTVFKIYLPHVDSVVEVA